MKATLHRDRIGYDQLVRDGHYTEPPSGLSGKYDNVRRIWENQITRFAIRPALARIFQAVRRQGRGIRILDLGCGAGEGLDLLLKVPLGTETTRGSYLLALGDLDAYHGIDLCPAMIDQAKHACRSVRQASFSVGDLAELGPRIRHQRPFDLYYNSYGSLSHLNDSQLHAMITGVLAHQPGPSVLLIDVHGQYSPEWPLYWGYSRDPEAPRMQPYNMVWMYPQAERPARLIEQSDYRIRYWRGEELRDFLRTIPGVAERLRSLTLIDRSILVGRHMDTGCFNPTSRPLRRMVNCLFEYNQITAPAQLRADPLPPTGDATADGFFDSYVITWNALVDWFECLINGDQPAAPADLCGPGGPIPAILQVGMEALVEQSRRLAWFYPGDPEANLLQPQFGLLLRQCEFHAQRGLGCGHGLLAVLELGPIGGEAP